MEREPDRTERAAAAGAGLLVYGAGGALRVETTEGMWIGSPTRAIWVPAGLEYRISTLRPADVDRIAIAAGGLLPPTPAAIVISPLLREVIAALAALPDGPRSARLMAVLLDHVQPAAQAPLKLHLGHDARLRRVTVPLSENPEDETALREWAKHAGASVRTLARLFAAETGLSFTSWRQKARVSRSISLLAAGQSVTEAAHTVGYEHPTAFIAAFKKFAGTTPARFFAA
jgi:AraC-like DNA-binding protein